MLRYLNQHLHQQLPPPGLAVSNPTSCQSPVFCGLATDYSKPAADQALVPVTAAGGDIAAASHSMSGTILGLVTSVECDKKCLVVAAVAKTLVAMEQSYVSAAFFRMLTKERLQRHQAEMMLVEGKLAHTSAMLSVVVNTVYPKLK